MSIPLSVLAAALNAETAKQHFADLWQASGSGFGLFHRAIAGMTLVEVDYDYAAHSGDVPRWTATVWRSAIAFDLSADDGRLAVLYLEAPAPSGAGPDDLKRIARFAVGALRLATAVELLAE